MVIFPNCKINLGLNIINKRNDGYHDIRTCFYPLPWHDGLEIFPLNQSIKENISTSKQVKITYQTNDVWFAQSGNAIEGNAEGNLCLKAFYLLKKQVPSLPPLFIHLHKVLPTQAGLGGGSADGTFTLKTIVQIFNLSIANNDLENLALMLGSDCPFFLYNKPCIAAGRGEQMQPISLSLNNYRWVVVNPNIAIPTAWAFMQIKPKAPKEKLEDILKQPIEYWRGKLINDFEEPIFNSYTAIKEVKEELYNAGAVYASLSGSGSAVYGIFPQNAKLKFNFPSTYIVHIL